MIRQLFIIFLFTWVLPLSVHAQKAIPIWEGTSVRSHSVTLTPYLPAGRPKAAIIVCPGGSYSWLSMKHEGSEVAEWLQQNGFAAFVLKYRVQGVASYIFHSRLLFKGNQYPDMIEDLQRTIQLLREDSTRYHLSDIPLGAMGFSAGGHLVMAGAEFFNTNYLQSLGIQSDVSLRPDFVVPVYPVVSLNSPFCHKRSRRALLGERKKHDKAMCDSLSLERHVPTNCPPVFLINCKDDPVVKYENAVMLDSALSAKGIPHHYLQYTSGGHGFGASNKLGSKECRGWKNEFIHWFNEIFNQ